VLGEPLAIVVLTVVTAVVYVWAVRPLRWFRRRRRESSLPDVWLF